MTTLNKSKLDAHTDRILKELGTMKFQDICSLHIGQFMFSYKHNLLPKTFDNLLTLNSQVHSYETRSAGSFQIPLCRTNICQFSIRYQGPKFFNSLADEIINSALLKLFTAIKQMNIFVRDHLCFYVCNFT